MSLKTNDQRFLPPGTTELCLCEKYLSIANRRGIKPLLFITGKTLIDEEVLLKQLLERFYFDVGGHTFAARSGLCRRLFYGFSKRIFNLANGPAFVQRKDIEQTCQIFRKKLGYEIRAWRNHAHRADRNTNKLLATLGFKIVSNRVENSDSHPLLDYGLWDIPINTIPDHQWLPHSLNQQPKISVNEWVKKVLEQIKIQQQMGIVSTIIAHPCCMYIEDNFNAFEELCQGIASYNPVSFEELLNLLS